MRINGFVSVKSDKLVFGVGKYTVGENIPAGEYYFWGADIWLTIISQGERRYSEFINDAYATLKDRDFLMVKSGSLTPVDNIVYEYLDNEFLYPNHVYKVGAEIPCGLYLFRFEKKLFSNPISFCAEDDAAFNKFRQYPYDRYHRFSGYFGGAVVDENDKYVALENGVAVYYCKDSIPDLYALLSSAKLFDNHYHHEGTLVMTNDLYAFKVFQKDGRDYLYHGEVDAIISEQYLYSISGRKFWAGFLNVISFKSYHWAEFIVEDLSTGKQYNLGDEHLSFKDVTDISNSKKDSPVRLYRIQRKDFFEIRLPDEISMEFVRIKSIRPDSSKEYLQLTSFDLTSQYSSELRSLAVVLEKYQRMGITIDIEKELKNFERAPDFISECSEFLENCLVTRTIYGEKIIDEAKRITFTVEATYDKTFYCAAKLADSAECIEASDNESLYQVTFRGTQIEEISLMLSVLTTPFNAEREDLITAREYLRNHDFFSYLTDAINRFIGDLRAEHGYSPFITSSVLVSINKAISKNERKKIHALYTAMARENRITTRWSNEYKLFTIVSKLVKDAVYQYRIEWLGQQSLDIFIPSQNIAIEYQGQQHYEPVDLFGGESALEDNIRRDIRKRELCAKHGVTVLDWKYSIPVNQGNVLLFFSEHGVVYTLSQDAPIVLSDHIQMAPVQGPKPRPEKTKKAIAGSLAQFAIRQFDVTGKFIAEYDSVQQAAVASGVSEKSIYNTMCGARKTGGGYIWQRCPRDSGLVDAIPVKRAENTGLAKKVLQYSKDGDFIAKHESIGQAAKTTGVNRRSISDVLSGTQRTAGGYIWRFADENQ